MDFSFYYIPTNRFPLTRILHGGQSKAVWAWPSWVGQVALLDQPGGSGLNVVPLKQMFILCYFVTCYKEINASLIYYSTLGDQATGQVENDDGSKKEDSSRNPDHANLVGGKQVRASPMLGLACYVLRSSSF
jgi:hypothetical protein